MKTPYNEILVEALAKIGYESQFEDSWHKVRTFNIEGGMWRNTIRKIIDALELRGTCFNKSH